MRSIRDMASTDERRLLNIHEASQYIGGISTATLYKMVSKRTIPFVKVGGRTMFIVSLLDRWLEENTIMPLKVG